MQYFNPNKRIKVLFFYYIESRICNLGYIFISTVLLKDWKIYLLMEIKSFKDITCQNRVIILNLYIFKHIIILRKRFQSVRKG